MIFLIISLEEVQYDDGTLTANEADEEDEVDDVPFPPHHQPSLRRYHRKGLMLLKNSESHTDDSIDDSDGSGVTTTTTATTVEQQPSQHPLKAHDTSIRRQQFKQHHNRKHVTTTHARYKTNFTNDPDAIQSRVASGLKLAQSQAMAVAGFLPMEPSKSGKKMQVTSARAARGLKFSVGSESMAGTDTTSLDVDASSLSVNRMSAGGGGGVDDPDGGRRGGVGRPLMLIDRRQRASFHGRG